jgi:ATP-dependent RNA helicase RhlE
LILSPTRELTLQIAENLAIYAKNSHLRHVVIFGGVGQHPQVRALREGVDIVVATPGRLMDLMQQGYVDLRHVQIFVLDEADRMLDMGFIEPIRHIAAAVPKQRQTLLFSATMPKEIRRLADSLLTDPVSIEVSPSSTLPVKIEHSVFHVHRGDKPNLLTTVLKTTEVSRALVFTRTKHGADKVAERLGRDGIIAEAIHGNKRQNVRQRTLANFKSGKTPVLVATDIAARGIDVDDVSHVINYELPHEPETYVHRIGRTGRAGNTGIAVSFCDHDERSFLRAIERLVKRPIEVVATPVLAKPVHEPRGQRPERPETAYHERSYPPRRPSHPTSSTGHRVSRPPAPRTGPGGGGGGEGHGGPPRGANRPHSGKPQGGGRPAGPRGQASGSGKPAASGQGQPASPGKGAGRRGQPGTGFRGNTRSGPPRA